MKNTEFEELVKKHSLESIELLDTVAFTGEAGEVAKEVKKGEYCNMIRDYRYRVDLELKEGKRNNRTDMIADEAGDTLFYLVKLLQNYGLTLEDVMEKQQQKLQNQSEMLNKVYKK